MKPGCSAVFGAALAAAVAALAFGALGCDAPSAMDTVDLGPEASIGREFVKQRGCATCHQSDHASDGTLAGREQPVAGSAAYGTNLTPDVATGLGGWADIEILRAMRYGIDDQQQALCPAMPHYDGSDPAQPLMTDVEADAIIAYLRALPPVSHAVPASMCPPIKPQPDVDMAAPPPTDDMGVPDMAEPADMTEPDHD